MKFFKHKVFVWIIVSLMILGLVATYTPLFFSAPPEPAPIPEQATVVLPSSPLVLVPTSTTPIPTP